MHVADPPILLTDVLSDVGAAVELLAQQAPYAPLGGWYNPGADPQARTRPLWFRGDWVNETYAMPGSDLFLHHQAYIECSKEFYGAEIVEPHSVYVNQMMAMGEAGPAHTDNPRFAGRDRTNTPMWLLRAMLWSGLFDDMSLPQATAIWWLNDVEGGGFRYWPNGPDEPPEEHVEGMANSALLGDNHGMFHQVNAVGPFEFGTPRVTPMARLAPMSNPEGKWIVTDHDQEIYRSQLSDIRVSVLWKADVYLDAEHRHRLDSNPLSLADIANRFDADLAERDVDITFDTCRINDPDHIAEITGHYPEARPVEALPSIFDY
ncbi:hypothetical protein [Candidatus Poriferisocius sp.]|uniref:hypothetical protein n=1 Tax=Candidatus Poriferisocius sp. TaxID=3101276 RepID=UPI003B0248FF